MILKIRAVGLAAAVAVCIMVFPKTIFAQQQNPPATTVTGGEKTVEESYLQESLEILVIKEQAKSDNRDMKLVALQYIKQAIDGDRKNEEIRRSLEDLALESTMVITRSAGLGRATNDFPDIRAKACEYLSEFPSVETKDALVKVALGDREPMVLSSAVRSLGKIGMNDGDEVSQILAFIINRFDVLFPDNSLAFESLVALERIADKNGGIKDPSAIRAVMRIATGNYINPVKTKATELLGKLRSYTASSVNSSSNSGASGSGK